MNRLEMWGYAHTARKETRRDYTMGRECSGAYPFWDKNASEAHPAVVTVFTMNQVGGSNIHNVVIGCSAVGDYFIWCGDNFVEGGVTKPPAVDRISMAAAAMPGAHTANEGQMANLRGAVEKSAACGFWPKFEANAVLCKHCNQLLLHKVDMFELDALLIDLDDAHTLLTGGTPVKPKIVVSENEFAKLVMSTPVLLEGEHGWGKTREARLFAERLGIKLIEVQGHESVEAADLTGYTVRYGHDMVWKDGRLSQAFRLAAKGIKVTLLLDELLRIPSRQLSVLLSALSPHKGNYYLATGRIVDVEDGIGSEETIVCPTENIYIIGTTNVGVQYAVDVMDPALQERFVLRRIYPSVAILKSAVQELASAKSFSNAVADQCAEFYEAMMKLKPNGLVADTPNPRTMGRAVHLSEKESDLKASVTVQALTWVGRDIDGNPVQEQVDAVLKAIAKVWK